MAKTALLTLGFFLVAGISFLSLPNPVHAASCEAIVGKWAWFTKGVVTFHPDGTMVHTPGNDGTWECTEAARGRVTLRWRQGWYVNQVALSADGNGLSSTDLSRQFVTAKRIGAEAKAPAKQDTSAPPPAPTQGDDAFLEGRRLAASGQCRDAIPYFNQAIQANPRYAKAYSDRGRCFAMLGQLDRGLQDLDRAVESAPNNMSPYFNRAGLRADAGDGDGALADLDRSIRIDPMNAASRAARRMNEVDGWLQKCYALDPSEREVAKRVFANIQAQEEQAARDMAARWWWNSPSSSSSSDSSSPGSSSGGGCSFTSYGACNAEKAGDRWAAERIERGTAGGSEKAWYGR